MDLGIKGKTALVLGASQGLGRAIALGLAGEGVNLAVVARTQAKLDSLKAEAEAMGISVSTHVLDLTDRAAVEAFADVVKADIKPDLFLSNAGGPPPSMALGVDPEVWRRSTEGMLFSIITLTEA
ncbi:MAG: SDR family NAD(P)-dependent oxidoreductase, partial [Pseudomonadota bacterium]